jgi:hypothetical protein
MIGPARRANSTSVCFSLAGARRRRHPQPAISPSELLMFLRARGNLEAITWLVALARLFVSLSLNNNLRSFTLTTPSIIIVPVERHFAATRWR